MPYNLPIPQSRLAVVPSFRMLPAEQLMEVLVSARKADLFVGGIVDASSGTLTLTRGDLTTWIVPLSIFPAADPSKPDFSRFTVDDYGYAIRFGDFETSAHALLYKIEIEFHLLTTTGRNYDRPERPLFCRGHQSTSRVFGKLDRLRRVIAEADKIPT